MKTLLIWDQVPEESDLYLLPDAPDWLVKVHGKYINAGGPLEPNEEQDKLLSRVSDAVCKNPDYYMNPEDELAGVWVGHLLLDDPNGGMSTDGPVKIVRCGFFL